MKTHFMLVLAAATAGISTLTTIAPASAGDVQGDAYPCEELWVMRNEIYKKNGFCFKTEKAISYFGIGGCTVEEQSDVPLSKQERSILHDIKKSEARQAC